MASRSDRVRFTILCEGYRDYYFIKAYLESAMGSRKVECFRSQTVPGCGSGEHQVQQLFPKELASHNKRPQRENHWLVVAIDGDGYSLDERRSQLRRKAGTISIPDERLAIVIPCRNLESWFHWIDTGTIEEHKTHKNTYRDVKPTQYGRQLRERCHHARIEFLPPSLKDACEQWRKIADRL